MPGGGERLIPAVSALMLALSFPPFHPLVLPFLGLVPITVWVADRPIGRAGRHGAMRGGLLFGLLYFGLVFHWVPFALVDLTESAATATLAFVVIAGGLALLTAFFIGLLHTIATEMGAPLWLALPVTWTTLEWTRAHLPSTLALPWLGLGTSLTAFPELVGIAELVGARGVTFWIAAVNGLVATLVVETRKQSARPRPGWIPVVVATVLVVTVPMSWGVWRARTLEMRPAARVAVVQPNRAAEASWNGGDGPDRLLERITPGSVDLVVLPEGLIGRMPDGWPDRNTATTDARLNVPGLATLQRHAREIGGAILFGATGSGSPATTSQSSRAGSADPSFAARPRSATYNSAFLMEPRGLADYRYDKRRLVPLVERAPFLPARATVGRDLFGAYEAGDSWPLGTVDETRFGVLICYESSYPSAARAFRLEGADVLVNITNDAWGSRRTMSVWSTALRQHPAHMVMRAIENRMGVARSAETGVSLFVDPVGRVVDATRPFVEDVRIAEVRTTDVVTFYTRFGDLLGGGSAFTALLFFSAAWWRSRGRSWPGNR